MRGTNLTRAASIALATLQLESRNLFPPNFQFLDARNRYSGNERAARTGEGSKYTGADIRHLTAERGCGAPYNKARRRAQKPVARS